VLAYLLLGLAQALGLLMIPFGAPGIWLQMASLGLYGWWTGFASFGVVPLLVLFLFALLAELLEPPLAGGRVRPEFRRFAGGAGLLGGAAGVAVGAAFPLVGSLLGAMLGAFVATTVVAPFVRPTRTGWGAMIGQTLAVSVRSGAAIAIAAYSLLSLVS
jgi:hypothetical protein